MAHLTQRQENAIEGLKLLGCAVMGLGLVWYLLCWMGIW